LTANSGATDEPREQRVGFPTTRWSLVLAAGQGVEQSAQPALAQLCTTYWYPIYAYARRLGHSRHDAEDLVQGFFAHAIEKNLVGRANPERGRFRSFLLTSFKHFVADEHDRASYQKRGGGRKFLPLDFDPSEERYRRERSDVSDPEKLFELSWAMTVLDATLRRLREEFSAAGKDVLFDELKSHLLADSTAETYAELSARLGMSTGALTNVVYRMRRRYREIFREEIQSTVSTEEDFESELQHLFAVLGRGSGAR
jgi:RNA polymerase sigma-70 factor (ECF subfamily)